MTKAAGDWRWTNLFRNHLCVCVCVCVQRGETVCLKGMRAMLDLRFTTIRFSPCLETGPRFFWGSRGRWRRQGESAVPRGMVLNVCLLNASLSLAVQQCCETLTSIANPVSACVGGGRRLFSPFVFFVCGYGVVEYIIIIIIIIIIIMEGSYYVFCFVQSFKAEEVFKTKVLFTPFDIFFPSACVCGICQWLHNLCQSQCFDDCPPSPPVITEYWLVS